MTASEASSSFIELRLPDEVAAGQGNELDLPLEVGGPLRQHPLGTVERWPLEATESLDWMVHRETSGHLSPHLGRAGPQIRQQLGLLEHGAGRRLLLVGRIAVLP